MSKLRFLFVPILIFFSYLEAHELNPARLILEEVEPYSFDVVWKFPSNVLTQPGSIVFPSICKETSKSLPEVEGKYLITYSSLVCESSLQGNELSVKGLSRMTDALISIRFSDGNKFEGLVSVNEPKLTIPGETNLYPTSYFWLGVDHLLSGIDHLLFVFGLIFLVQGMTILIKTITAFTLAHSITLGLSVFGVVQLPQATAEALIALTLVYLALEIGSKNKYLSTPWFLAFGFGLLHGFGFAGALSEIGFANENLLFSLLFFNLGIEAGQLAILPIVGLIIWFFNRIKFEKFSYKLSSYAIGGMGTFWLIERMIKIIS